MKLFYYSFFSLLICLVACEKVTESDLQYLNGYWEITRVESHGEVFQPQGIAPSVDAYFMDNLKKGIKKKMTPHFSGNYQSSNDQFAFSIVLEENTYYIDYQEALLPWREKIIKLTSEELIVFHRDKKYVYKRHLKPTSNVE